jgi:hypothetical protein
MTIASIIAHDGTMTLFLSGKPFVIAPDHPNYEDIKTELRHTPPCEEALLSLCDIPAAVVEYAGPGGIDIVDGVVVRNGEPLHNSLTARILDLMREGFPFEPMLKFLDRLMENPSAQSVNELYDFLAHKGLPITDDGCFLAYKGIRDDWMDKYSGTIDNSIGQVVVFDRNQVDDDRRRQCSFGLHVGTLDYVRSYCTERVVVVKVDPADCVSVPLDHDATKLRVCRYEVLEEFEDEFTQAYVPRPSKDETWWDEEHC